MSEVINQINKEFREILEKLNSSGQSAKEMIDVVNKRFIAEGCYLRGKTPEEPKPFPIFIKPYFVTRERIAHVAHAANVIMGVLEKVTDLYFSNPEMKPIFQLKPEEEELASIEHGLSRKVKITRNDAFLTDEYFKFIEFNTDSPGGPKYSDVQGEIIGNTPVMWELRKKYRFHTDFFMPVCLRVLIDSYREFGGKKDRPFIALVAGEGSATLPEFKLISKWLRETQGYDSEYSDPRWLTYNGKNLYTRSGKVVDIIYRRGWLPDWTDHMSDIKPLIQAYKDKKVCVVNPPHSIIASNKSLIGVIQEAEIQKMFSSEEIKVIKENVPWTRLVKETKTLGIDGEEVDLYEYIRKNRERLVLKPFDMFGGKDVCVGPEANQKTWEEWVEKTTKHRFVAQEYVGIPEEDLPDCKPDLGWYPKKINVNFFAYDGCYAGGMVRTSESAIINISAGGGLIPILVLEGSY